MPGRYKNWLGLILIYTARLSSRAKWSIFLPVFLSYWVAYPFLLPLYGSAYRLLGFVYVILASSIWGASAGILVTAVGLGLGLGYNQVAGSEYLGGLSGPLWGVLSAYFIGSLRDLAVRLNGALAQSESASAEKEKLIDDLNRALADVKTLEGLIPICASCKSIRDDHDLWRSMEEYIEGRSQARFTHSLCPDCVAKLYPDMKLEQEK